MAVPLPLAPYPQEALCSWLTQKGCLGRGPFSMSVREVPGPCQDIRLYSSCTKKSKFALALAWKAVLFNAKVSLYPVILRSVGHLTKHAVNEPVSM